MAECVLLSLASKCLSPCAAPQWHRAYQRLQRSLKTQTNQKRARIRRRRECGSGTHIQTLRQQGRHGLASMRSLIPLAASAAAASFIAVPCPTHCERSMMARSCMPSAIPSILLCLWRGGGPRPACGTPAAQEAAWTDLGGVGWVNLQGGIAETDISGFCRMSGMRVGFHRQHVHIFLDMGS